MVEEDIGGMSINTSFFNGNDYGYWKHRMEIFLNTFDHRVWGLIIDGYIIPNKPHSKWTTAEAYPHKFNFRALNAIVGGLTLNEFRKIGHLKTTKEA